MLMFLYVTVTENLKGMKNAWKDLAEAVPYLSDFFRPEQPSLKDTDVIYFLNTTTDYIYNLEQGIECWKARAQRYLKHLYATISMNQMN